MQNGQPSREGSLPVCGYACLVRLAGFGRQGEEEEGPAREDHFDGDDCADEPCGGFRPAAEYEAAQDERDDGVDEAPCAARGLGEHEGESEAEDADGKEGEA